MENKIPSPLELAEIADEYHRRPVVIPNEVVEAMQAAAKAGLYSCSGLSPGNDWQRVVQALRQAGYQAEARMTGPNEAQWSISWKGANSPQEATPTP